MRRGARAGPRGILTPALLWFGLRMFKAKPLYWESASGSGRFVMYSANSTGIQLMGVFTLPWTSPTTGFSGVPSKIYTQGLPYRPFRGSVKFLM